MKTISRYIVILAVALAFPACSGFLDENPKTSLSEITVYRTEAALEAQVYGNWLALHSGSLWKGTMNEFLHTGSGLLMWKGQRKEDEWLDGMNFAKYSTTKWGNGDIWTALYSGVNRCNRLLDALPSSPVDEGFKTEVEAETKLIRAILYYTAVRLWGDVPLVVNAPKSYAELNVPRTHFATVYKQVIDDLEFAEKYMRDPARAAEVAPGKGRPNKWAATAMKASVYLTIGSLLSSPDDNFWDTSKPGRIPDFSPCGINSAADAFTLAYNTAEKVITEGPYSLVPDFRTLFRWTEAGDWSLPERIICLESSNTTGTNYNSVRMLPAYPEGSANTNTQNNNWGRVRPSRFLIDNFIRVGGGSKGDATEDMLKDIYTTTSDPRFKASFFVTYRQIQSGNEKTINTYPVLGGVNTSSDTYSMPYCKKYLDPTYDVTNGAADFYLMRLAEVYLISAEASASLSTAVGDDNFNKALARLNDIRDRARNSTDGAPASQPIVAVASDYATVEDLVNTIMWERVIEMNCEGHEWFDTHRRGATWLRDNIAIPENAFLQTIDANETHWKYSYTGAFDRGYTFPTDVAKLRKSLLCALPYSEITYNTVINEQNDFYWQ